MLYINTGNKYEDKLMGFFTVNNQNIFKLSAGMTTTQLEESFEGEIFKNEKKREKALNKAVSLFNKIDSDNDGRISDSELKQYETDKNKKRNIAIICASVAAVALAAGITYFIKSGKAVGLIDKITQSNLEKSLRKSYGENANIQKGVHGSLYMPSDAGAVPNWKVDGKTDFDKFIKRYGMTAVDDAGNEIGKYTMATRGGADAAGNVTMIAPVYKDKFGRTWTIMQEEARPIDLLRRGTEARVLAFPAGCIGDEAAFISESAMQSAVRELTEETGLIPSKIENLSPLVIKNGEKVATPIMTSPGLTDEATYFYKATVDKIQPSAKAVTDGGVTRGWHFVPVRHLSEWFKSLGAEGKIPNGQTLSAIALLKGMG